MKNFAAWLENGVNFPDPKTAELVFQLLRASTCTYVDSRTWLMLQTNALKDCGDLFGARSR
jgi:hypothetical protein